MTTDKSNCDLNAIPAPASAPTWFLENCVVTAEDLAAGRQKLLVTPEKQLASRSDDTYILENAMYAQLRSIACGDNSLASQTVTSVEVREDYFSHDAICLQFASRSCSTGGQDFLCAAVRYLAKDVGADLICVNANDLSDLCEGHDHTSCVKTDDTTSESTTLTEGELQKIQTDSDGAESEPDNIVTANEETKINANNVSSRVRDAGADEPVLVSLDVSQKIIETTTTTSAGSTSHQSSSAKTDGTCHTALSLVSSPNTKRSVQGLQLKKRPLIIQIRDVSTLDQNHRDILSCFCTTIRSLQIQAVAVCIYDKLETPKPTKKCRCYLCMSHDDDDKDDDQEAARSLEAVVEKSLSAAGKRPLLKPIVLAPLPERTQQTLLEQHEAGTYDYTKQNVRVLQRAIRKSFAYTADAPFLQPYFMWDLSSDTGTANLLAEKSIDSNQIKQFLDDQRSDLTQDEFYRRITQTGARLATLKWWYDRERRKDRTKWSSFSKHTQDVIKSIEADRGLRQSEVILSCIINPAEVRGDMSKIALDSDSSKHVVRLIRQQSGTRTGAKKARPSQISGALLYGPPGTGKTHLARYLATQTEAVVLCVSAADLLSKWVGDTEQIIQDLFKIARMLSPSIIFIDEADALFMARKDAKADWKRSMTNQLLSEMDGFRRNEVTPFTLLATNHPENLDTAVLRRVPSRLYIGLPDVNCRREIFEICLQGEDIRNVDLLRLSQDTVGFSGSDISTLCTQAALEFEISLQDRPADSAILEHEHFIEALRTQSSTVSAQRLVDILKFAEEYDRPAAKKIRIDQTMTFGIPV